MASAKKSASATFTRSVKQPEPEINVTPLVDVVLVLLIIFMVIAPNLQEGTPVVLPEIDAVDEEKHEDTIEVAMTADGKLWLEDEERTPLVADRAEALEEPRRGEHHAHVSGDRLHDDGGDGIRMGIELRAHGIEVVVWREQRLGDGGRWYTGRIGERQCRHP